jgi:hypothetical protein
VPVKSTEDHEAGNWNASPAAAVICDEIAVIDTEVAVPVPRTTAAAPPATEIVEPERLSVVAESVPPTEMPVFEPYVTRHDELDIVSPTLDTTPPNRKQLPEEIVVLPDSVTDDDVKDTAPVIPRNAPVDGTNSELASAMIVASATFPVAVMMFRPYIDAVDICIVDIVLIAAKEKASVVEMHEIVVLISEIATLLTVPAKAWFDVDDMDMLHAFIVISMLAVVLAAAMPVLKQPVLVRHV